jgi:hypothetical protein
LQSEGSGIKKTQGVERDLKKSDMETWHPAKPGKPAGSQKGVKTSQKLNPNSKVSPFTK